MSAQFTKQVCERLDYKFNWVDILTDGDTIASYTITEDGVTIDSDTLINSDTAVQFFASAGVVGAAASVHCTVVTTNGLEDCATIYFTIVVDTDQAQITVAQVNKFYPASAEVDDEFVQCYIDIVSSVDACLNSSYDDCMIKMLKLNAVAYLLYSSGQLDGVKHMRSPTGESVTFSDAQIGEGLSSNQYGRYVNMMDKSGCLIALLESPENNRFFVAVGKSNNVTSC